MSYKKKALFLDRDGVINIDHGYVCSFEQCEFIGSIFEILKAAKNKEYFIVVVTNQSGIGRGYYSESDFYQFMAQMNEFLNGYLDAVYFCPFHEKYGLGKYKVDSFDRKPKPGMFLRAIKEHNLDPERSIMIGDKESDVVAAMQANVHKIFLLAREAVKPLASCIQISDLFEIIPYL